MISKNIGSVLYGHTTPPRGGLGRHPILVDRVQSLIAMPNSGGVYGFTTGGGCLIIAQLSAFPGERI